MSEKRDVEVSQQWIKEPNELLDGSYQIDKIIYYPSKKLGQGCVGTKVFEGTFQKRSIAVKRLMKEYLSDADKEAANLRCGDDHENVLQYYATEQCSTYIYIALQLCIAL
jgi:serine/threonine-protein kinase/endoribonuclease IRE1